MKRFVLIIYPLDFPNVKPDVQILEGFTHINDANDYAKIVCYQMFNHPSEFKGCHVVEVK